MKRELAEIIVEACKMYSIDATIYEDYSGRGMYGRKTTGVEIDNAGLAYVMSTLIANADMLVDCEYNYPEPLFGDEDLRTDSMGLGTILY